MPDCPNIAKCIFFNDRMASKPAMAGLMKTRYCQGDFAACARYLVCTALGGPQVPADLFPNQIDRAKAQLTAAGKPA